MKAAYCGLTLLAFGIVQNSIARVGCMDNSWHLARKYDHKEWHYVQCNCPCERQYQIAADGTCTKCAHRRKETFIYRDTTKPEKLMNIARLQKYSAAASSSSRISQAMRNRD